MTRHDARLAGSPLADTVTWVTGAGSGLGRATAEHFAARGSAVLCSDRDAEQVASTVAAIEAAGGSAAAHVGDVTLQDDCEAAVTQALAELGGLHVVVANAGIPGEGRAHELSEQDWSRVLSVNLTGTFLTVRAALPHLMAQRSGSIILQSSIAGLVGVPNIPAYAAAKGGVIALGRQLARDYAAHEIRVNVIAPGTILTPLVEQAYRERHGDEMQPMLDRRAAAVPLGRFGDPTDIAQAALYLATATWVTGTVLTVDGGNVHLAAVDDAAR